MELEPEVADWLEGLDDQRWAQDCSIWICLSSGRRIIALTVFTKTRMQETGEIRRALRAMTRCQQESHLLDEESEEGPA